MKRGRGSRRCALEKHEITSEEPIRMKIRKGPLFIFEEMPWLKSASVGFFVPTGSASESKEIAGITHFIEHLVFKGTETKSPRDIALAFEGSGGMLNASTGKEFLDIFGRIGSRHLKRGFNVIADMILNPRFLPSDIEKEKGVILEEIRMVNDIPEQFLFEKFSKQIWGKSSLARSIAGDEKSLSSIKLKNIRKWFREHFNSSRIIISISGDVDKESVIGWWKEISGQKNHVEVCKGRSIEHEIKPLKPDWNPGVKIYRRDFEQASVVMGFPAPSAHMTERYSFSIVETLLGGGMGARLFQEIREKSGLTYDIDCGYSPLRGTGVFTVDSATAPDLLFRLIDRILGELRKIKSKKATGTELEKVRDFVEGGTLLGLESSSNRMMRNGMSQMYLGEIIPMDIVMGHLKRVTASDVLKTAHEYFTLNNFACGVLIPNGMMDDSTVHDKIMKIAEKHLG